MFRHKRVLRLQQLSKGPVPLQRLKIKTGYIDYYGLATHDVESRRSRSCVCWRRCKSAVNRLFSFG